MSRSKIFYEFSICVCPHFELDSFFSLLMHYFHWKLQCSPVNVFSGIQCQLSLPSFAPFIGVHKVPIPGTGGKPYFNGFLGQGGPPAVSPTPYFLHKEGRGLGAGRATCCYLRWVPVADSNSPSQLGWCVGEDLMVICDERKQENHHPMFHLFSHWKVSGLQRDALPWSFAGDGCFSFGQLPRDYQWAKLSPLVRGFLPWMRK